MGHTDKSGRKRQACGTDTGMCVDTEDEEFQTFECFSYSYMRPKIQDQVRLNILL